MPQVARQGRRAQRRTARDSRAVLAPILSPLRACLGARSIGREPGHVRRDAGPAGRHPGRYRGPRRGDYRAAWVAGGPGYSAQSLPFSKRLTTTSPAINTATIAMSNASSAVLIAVLPGVSTEQDAADDRDQPTTMNGWATRRCARKDSTTVYTISTRIRTSRTRSSRIGAPPRSAQRTHRGNQRSRRSAERRPVQSIRPRLRP